MKLIAKLIVFILFPFLALVIISNHIRDKSTENSYAITNLTGLVFIQYQAQYPDPNIRDEDDKIYEVNSNWLPLTEDMYVGARATVKTEVKSSIDLLLDDGMAFRIKEDTVAKINENPQGTSRVQVMLSQGKILANLVASKLKRLGSRSTYKIRVDTNTAVCGIRGTIFSVGSPSASLTDVAVLEGTANVFRTGDFPEQTDDLRPGLDVPGGKKVAVPNQRAGLDLRDITEEERKELQEAEKLKIENSLFDRIKKALTINLTPLYGGIMKQIADYAMNSIVKGCVNNSQLSQKLPDKLRDLELAMGSYNDPWGTEFAYIRMSDRKAILISAGPDKIRHTPDDVHKYIKL